MSSTIFNDQLATGLKDWHRTAKKNAKHSNHTGTRSPISSTPSTPIRGTSPVHLLHNYHHSSHDSLHPSPRRSHVRNDHWDNNESHSSRHLEQEKPETQEPSSLQLPSAPPDHTQHEINISSSFAFRKWVSQCRLDHRRISLTYNMVCMVRASSYRLNQGFVSINSITFVKYNNSE